MMRVQSSACLCPSAATAPPARTRSRYRRYSCGSSRSERCASSNCARSHKPPSSDLPMREGSRDGQGGCLMCGGPRPSIRAQYCTHACQQRSYRLRHQPPTADLSSVRKALQLRQALVAHTIYECGGCGERFLGERRCRDCNVFARAVGVGGVCPECDTPVLLDDLLGEGVVPTT